MSISGEIVRDALDLMTVFSLAFWDAAIVASANMSHSDVLLSEDMTHGARYGLVRFSHKLAHMYSTEADISLWDKRTASSSSVRKPLKPALTGTRGLRV